MKLYRLFATSVLLLATMVGCRDSQTSVSPPPSRPYEAAPTAALPSTQVPKDDRPIIVAFGDSLTAGYGADPGQGYPDFLQKLLDAQHYQYRVVNFGISGNTTKDGVDRIKDVLELKPKIAIVEFGGNDGLRGLPIATTRENLDTIVRELKQAGVQVVLAGITLPPNYGADYVEQFNKTYVIIARNYNVPMIPFLLKGVYGVAGSMQEDQTHATAQGNQQVAQNVLALLTPLLHKS